MNQVNSIRRQLRKAASPGKAKILQRFFKTGPGQYGEGDRFLGVMVPAVRRIAKGHCQIGLDAIADLIKSPIHEERLLALMILTLQFPKANKLGKRAIYDFYLGHTRWINNWDLVDLSAPNIVGAYLADKDKSILRRLARSQDLWQRRIAVLATFYFIKQKNPSVTIELAQMLLEDDHDLIHKAVGWMLREVGKRCSEPALEDFLNKNVLKMPRTMLRYAIERLPPIKRREYLLKK